MELIDVVEAVTKYTLIKEDEVWRIAEKCFSEYSGVQKSGELVRVKNVVSQVNKRLMQITPQITQLLTKEELHDFQSKVDLMNSKLEKSDFLDLGRLARGNLAFCKELLSKEKQLLSVQKWQNKFLKLRNAFDCVHANRFCGGEIKRIQSMYSKFLVSLQNRKVSVALDEIKRVNSLARATSLKCRDQRFEEMESFVASSIKTIQRDENREVKKHEISSLAKDYHLTNSEANRLVQYAVKKAGNETLAMLPAEVYRETLTFSSKGILSQSELLQLLNAERQSIPGQWLFLLGYALVVLPVSIAFVTMFFTLLFSVDGLRRFFELLFVAVFLTTIIASFASSIVSCFNLLQSWCVRWGTIIAGAGFGTLLTCAASCTVVSVFESMPGSDHDSPTILDAIILVRPWLLLAAWPIWLFSVRHVCCEGQVETNLQLVCVWAYRSAVFYLSLALPIHFLALGSPNDALLESLAGLILGLFIAIASIGPRALISTVARNQRSSGTSITTDFSGSSLRKWRHLAAFCVSLFLFGLVATTIGFPMSERLPFVANLAVATVALSASIVIIVKFKKELFCNRF